MKRGVYYSPLEDAIIVVVKGDWPGHYFYTVGAGIWGETFKKDLKRQKYIRVGDL